jgi:hypothetical protein
LKGTIENRKLLALETESDIHFETIFLKRREYYFIFIFYNLHLRFIQLMMYVVFIIDRIHHLRNEFKMLIFAYNINWRVQ